MINPNPYAGIQFDAEHPENPPINSVIHKADTKVSWKNFDSNSYLEAGKLKQGEDRYAKNKFNQAASDAVQWDRSIADSREYQ